MGEDFLHFTSKLRDRLKRIEASGAIDPRLASPKAPANHVGLQDSQEKTFVDAASLCSGGDGKCEASANGSLWRSLTERPSHQYTEMCGEMKRIPDNLSLCLSDQGDVNSNSAEITRSVCMKDGDDTNDSGDTLLHQIYGSHGNRQPHIDSIDSVTPDLSLVYGKTAVVECLCKKYSPQQPVQLPTTRSTASLALPLEQKKPISALLATQNMLAPFPEGPSSTRDKHSNVSVTTVELNDLPVELSVWIVYSVTITLSTSSSAHTVLFVRDGRGFCLACKCLPLDTLLSRGSVIDLVSGACLFPSVGVPRRPTCLRLHGDSLRRFLSPHDSLYFLGIELQITSSRVDVCSCLGTIKCHRVGTPPKRPLAVPSSSPQVFSASGGNQSDVPVSPSHHSISSLASLSISSQPSVSPPVSGSIWVRLRSCSVCYYSGEESILQRCPNCCAFFYCSKTCHSHDIHHAKFCSFLKVAASNRDEACEFPFPFAASTASSGFTPREFVAFLEERGLLGKGYWRAETPSCAHSISLQSCVGVSFNDWSEVEKKNPFVLLREAIYLDVSEGDSYLPLSQPLTSWGDYFEARGLDLSSPIAILLHWPLTLYYIITSVVGGGHSSLTVYIGGAAYREVTVLPLFFELAYLLPNVALRIVLVGDELPTYADGISVQRKNVSLEAKRGLVDTLLESESSGRGWCAGRCLFVGFNAGLTAYPQWIPTLRLLTKLQIPAVFTDYCEYNWLLSRKCVEEGSLSQLTDAVLNPFRSPLRRTAEEHDLVWFSNAYIFSLVQTSSSLSPTR